MAKNPYFGPDFGRFWPQFCPKNFFVGFTSTRYQILLPAIIVCNFKENLRSKLEKMTKTQFWDQFWSIWPKFQPPNFFSKIQLLQSLYIIVSYYHVQYQKKTNDPILRKRSDERTEERTDGQIDETHFIVRCRLTFYALP